MMTVSLSGSVLPVTFQLNNTSLSLTLMNVISNPSLFYNVTLDNYTADDYLFKEISLISLFLLETCTHA